MEPKLVTDCAVSGCYNCRHRKGRRSFHSMPKELDRLGKWIEACQRKDLEELLKTKGPAYFQKNIHVCSVHFEKRFFRNQDVPSQGLYPEAIPTLKLLKPILTKPMERSSVIVKCPSSADSVSTNNNAKTESSVSTAQSNKLLEKHIQTKKIIIIRENITSDNKFITEQVSDVPTDPSENVELPVSAEFEENFIKLLRENYPQMSNVNKNNCLKKKETKKDLPTIVILPKNQSECAIYGCNNCKNRRGSRSFYSMPRKLDRLKKWVAACKRKDLNDLLNTKDTDYFHKYLFVCSDHFDAHYFRNKNMPCQGLLPSAVPTINLFNFKTNMLEPPQEIKESQMSTIISPINKPRATTNDVSYPDSGQISVDIHEQMLLKLQREHEKEIIKLNQMMDLKHTDYVNKELLLKGLVKKYQIKLRKTASSLLRYKKTNRVLRDKLLLHKRKENLANKKHKSQYDALLQKSEQMYLSDDASNPTVNNDVISSDHLYCLNSPSL